MIELNEQINAELRADLHQSYKETFSQSILIKMTITYI